MVRTCCAAALSAALGWRSSAAPVATESSHVGSGLTLFGSITLPFESTQTSPGGNATSPFDFLCKARSLPDWSSEVL